MTAAANGPEPEALMEEGLFDAGVDVVEEAPSVPGAAAEERLPRSRLPWIGALENPRVGLLVVLNESGYLVPLLTAADLLRGCRYYWQRL
jgi:hypothetical protein